MDDQQPSSKGESDSASTQAAEPPAVTEADIAERPVLAADIELSGEMQGAGFSEQQWLVIRDGRFIQLTELLYRVAGAATGERTVEQMADTVAEQTGKGVSADNIRHLLVNRLIPMGLVAKADGTAVPQADTQRGALSVNMRMKMVGPELTERLTAPFKVLFHPLILVPALILGAIAHGWLYFVHGVGDSFRRAIEPGLLLGVLGTVLIATAWHEFGMPPRFATAVAGFVAWVRGSTWSIPPSLLTSPTRTGSAGGAACGQTSEDSTSTSCLRSA